MGLAAPRLGRLPLPGQAEELGTIFTSTNSQREPASGRENEKQYTDRCEAEHVIGNPIQIQILSPRGSAPGPSVRELLLSSFVCLEDYYFGDCHVGGWQIMASLTLRDIHRTSDTGVRCTVDSRPVDEESHRRRSPTMSCMEACKERLWKCRLCIVPSTGCSCSPDRSHSLRTPCQRIDHTTHNCAVVCADEEGRSWGNICRTSAPHPPPPPPPPPRE